LEWLHESAPYKAMAGFAWKLLGKTGVRPLLKAKVVKMKAERSGMAA